MDAWFEENGWGSEEIFFKTDHHWLPQAALQAVCCTMEELTSKGVASYQEEWLEEENYEITTYENWYLGSEGKRTGAAYAGADDFTVYVPKFDVDYTYSYFDGLLWNYSDTILDLSFFGRKNFQNHTYGTYMTGDWRIRNTYNKKALNEKTVLLMGDSFKMPYEYFLTTQFQEVYTIDLRYYTDGTFAEYVAELKPDIVIMCTNESWLDGEELYSFGVEDYNTRLADTSENELVVLGDIKLEAQEDNENQFAVVCGNLKENQTYTITVDDIEISCTGEEQSYVQMTLQNLTTNEVVYNRYFDAENDQIQRWIFTVPEDKNVTYAVYLYAGSKGQTAGVSVNAENICIQEGIIE